MKQNVKINFYNIQKCGYYKFGKRQCEFLDSKELFNNLILWVQKGNKNLSETATYEISSSDNGVLRTFCFAIKAISNGTEYLLTTWNETESLDGALASVDGASHVGNPSVTTTQIPVGHIPGYPTYFWIVPDKKVFATFRFDSQRLNGHKGLRLWLSGFMQKCSSHVVRDDQDTIIGFQKNSTSPIEEDLRPYFESYPMRTQGEIDYLQSNLHDVSKIIRKSTLKPNNPNDKGFLSKILANMGVTRPARPFVELKVKAELDFTPNMDEFSDILEQFKRDKTSWNDVGFKIGSEIHWLSHSLVKDELEFDIIKDTNGIVNLDSLEKQISINRNHLFSAIP